MVGKTAPQQKPLMSYQPTPRDEAKKVVNEMLKRVDQLIHKGELDRAQLELIKVKDVDPHNMYALALEERISILKEEIVTAEETQHQKGPISTTVTGPVSQKEAGSTQTTKSQPTAVVPAIATSPVASIPSSDVPAPRRQEENVLDRSVELDSYRQALTHAWNDGALTEIEKRQLQELQMVFDITKDDCERIEKAVKYECYRDALLQQISDNPMRLLSQKSLIDLQRTFQISEEEHQQIQTQLMNTLEQKQREKVLIIDDDIRLLELLTSSLEDNGFDVTALPTSDEAYTLLRKFVPDLILCDINLETSTMDGFSFYEKIQKLNNIQKVPFIFLTGLTDEILVRTGKELGVDDYLLKPISEQTLVSALRGKLKRFKQLKKLSDSPLQAIAAA